MKKTILSRSLLLASGVLFALCGPAHAEFTPIALNPVSFNQDPVVEATAPISLSAAVSATMDGGTNKTGATWYEVGYNLASPTTGIPVAGSLVTNAAVDHTFRMAPNYHANNVIMAGHGAGGQTPILASGTFVLTTPAAFTGLSFLNSCGNGPVTVGYRIHYADTTTEEGTFTSLDWFNNSANVFNAAGRVSIGGGGLQNVGGNPAGAVFAADVPVGNPGLNIVSIDLFYAGSGSPAQTYNNGRSVIFAVSGTTDNVSYGPITVTGYTYDAVMEADGPQTTGTGVAAGSALTNLVTATMDGGSTKANNTWYEKGYYAGFPTTGLPAAGSSVTSAWYSARYTMPSSYVGNCATMLSRSNLSANITFATPGTYGALSFLCATANGDTFVPCVIQFADGTTENNTLFVPDWFNRVLPQSYLSFGRVNPNNNSLNQTPDQFVNPFAVPYPYSFDYRGLALPTCRLFDAVINVANTATAITNISLSFTNGDTRVAAIFAVSGAAAGNVPPVYGATGTASPGQPANSPINNITLIKRWEGTNNMVLSVTNIAGTAISYQWKKAPRGGGLRDIYYSFDYSTFANVVNGGRISGATSSALVISNALAADSADYLVVASNPYGSATSTVATVMILTTNQSVLVGAPAGDVIAQTANDGTPGPESVDHAIDRVAQKWLSDGLQFPGACCGGPSPWVGPVGFTVTPVSGASIVTSLRFYTANDSQARDPLDYFLEGSNDGTTWTPITGGKIAGTLTLPTGRNGTGSTPVDALGQFVTEVDFANATGYKNFRFSITNILQRYNTPLMQIAEVEMLGTLVPNPPVWVRQPDPTATVYAGGSPTFGVSAVGYPQPAYQWYKNGITPIPNATNATYTFPNAQLVDSGTTFSCRATNVFGLTNSTSATLSVIAAPAQPYPASVQANSPIGYWRLDEGPDDGLGNNGVLAKDYFGGHNGYYSNAVINLPGYNPVADPDTAAGFGNPNPLNSYVANINDVDFSRATNAPGGTFSVEAWVFGGNQTLDAAIVTKGYNGALNAGTGTGTEQFVLDVAGATPKMFRFLVRDAAGNGHVAQSTAVPYNPLTLQPALHHLVGVCNQPLGKVYLYVDGLLAGSGDIATNGGILTQPLPMAIGSRQSSGAAQYDNQWVGTIDDVAVYNTALSASQVQTHYYASQQPPQISLQPTNIVWADNSVVTFYAAAYGPGTLGYQWYLSDSFAPIAAVPGQTSPNLSFTTTPAQNGNYYQLVVTNNYGSVTSLVAQLSVVSGPPTVLVDLPASQFFYAGRTMVFSVTVGGTAPFTYQWQRNGGNLVNGGRISGATSNVLTIAYAGSADSGNYQLLITGVGPGQSSVDAVTVQAVPQLNASGAGWTLQGTTAPTMDSGTVTLTSGLGSTARAVFYNAPLYVGAFSASFVYTDVGGGGADGATFCIQNAPAGAAALGGGGGSLGFVGITPSVALAINIYNPNTPGLALLQNGAGTGAGVYSTPTPVAVDSGSPVQFNILYSGGVMQVSMVQSNGTATASRSYSVNIPTVVGADTAFVGFTGADGGVVSTQVISNFTFVPLTTLSAQLSAPNSLLLSWPASIGGYVPQSRGDLAAGIWQDVVAPVLPVGNQNQVTISPLNTNQFYRLKIQVP